ncbi:MAG: glycoside hydrolase family 5 protein [Planctomycetaceae bacterium]|nr:glycoside hydrolase family 5 protein [Planctomycetaceae bacterium]
MRTTFFTALFLFTTATFAEEWIEFPPPMMDDVTVDPLRFTRQGTPFDLSDPMFRPIEHGQTARVSRSDQTTKEMLVIDYEFTGRGNLEYVEIQTSIKIDKPGFNIGGVFTTDAPKAGPIRVRLRDPSGEIHQHTLGYPKGLSNPGGGQIFATIETSPDPAWGGDGDKILQFPCEIVSILMDKPEQGFAGKGTLTITDLALYEAVELRDVLKIEFAADSPPGLLFTEPGTLRLRLTPKNLNEGETLFAKDIYPLDRRTQNFPPHIARTARAGLFGVQDTPPGVSLRIDQRGTGNPAFPGMEPFIIDGTPQREKMMEITGELLRGRPAAQQRTGFIMQDTTIAMLLVWEVPPEGVIYEIPITTQGAARIVFVPAIVKSDSLANMLEERISNPTGYSLETIPALPVAFSYGSIVPNLPQDDRIGVCTHYAQRWNMSTMDFAVKGGFGMIRDELYWASVERERGVLALPEYARYVDLALEKGLEPLIILNYSNRLYDNNDFPHSDEAVAAFANYARFIAEQFKGKVKYFEVWNEWFIACGMRHAERGGNNTPENYVKLLQATYEAIKSVNPDAVVIGGGGDHPNYHRPQMEALFKLGVMDYCDAFSIHPYRQPRTPEESGLVEEVLGFAEMMRQHGVESPKLWLTEIGWPTPKKHPAADAELFQAAMVIRSVVPLLATDVVEKYFWYDLKNDGLDRIDQEHNFGLIRHERLGFQVKPAFVAFAVMSGNTAGRDIKRDETLSQDGVYAYRLTKDGEADRLVLWVEHGQKPVQLPAFASATNMFGTPLLFPSETITLTDEPIWVVLR